MYSIGVGIGIDVYIGINLGLGIGIGRKFSWSVFRELKDLFLFIVFISRVFIRMYLGGVYWFYFSGVI